MDLWIFFFLMTWVDLELVLQCMHDHLQVNSDFVPMTQVPHTKRCGFLHDVSDSKGLWGAGQLKFDFLAILFHGYARINIVYQMCSKPSFKDGEDLN